MNKYTGVKIYTKWQLIGHLVSIVVMEYGLLALFLFC